MNLTPEQKQRARRLRQRMTPTERRLWGLLRDRRFDGVKFRRKQPIGPYTVDFYCHEKRLVLELDGESHVGKEARDRKRAAWLSAQGYCVVRIWDIHMYGNPEGVMQLIYNALHSTAPHSSIDPQN